MSAPGRGTYQLQGGTFIVGDDMIDWGRALRFEFERCRPWIEAALKYSGGTHTTDDVLERILRRELQLWTEPSACAVTEIEFYPRRKICHIFLAGGNLESLKVIEERITVFARKAGCSAVTVTGRKGWARTFLKDRGYEEKTVVLARELGAPDGQRQQTDHHTEPDAVLHE